LLESRQLLAIFPVALGGVSDQLPFGSPDSVEISAYVVQESWHESRAIAEFPLASVGVAPSLATLNFVLNVPAGGDDLRALRVEIYAGNGSVDLADFQAAAVESRSVYYWSSQLTRDYQLDMADAIGQLLATGATHLGVRWDAVADQNQTSVISPKLHVDALPAPSGFREVESVPNAIRADGADGFRVEIDTHGDVAEVSMNLFLDWSTEHTNGVVALRDDGLQGDRRAGDFVFTSPLIRYPVTRAFPDGFYMGQLDSPPGLAIQDVGDIIVTELDGSQEVFFRRAEVGLVRSDIGLVDVDQLASDVQVSDHFVNIRTTESATQQTLRGNQVLTHSLFERLYDVLPDAFDIVNLISTERIEQRPRQSGSNFRAGVHSVVKTDYKGSLRELHDQSASYGSDGRLKGYSILDDFTRGLGGPTVTHELVHQWSAYVHSSVGISDGGAHYLYNTSVGSLVGGYEWIDNGDGSYTMNDKEGRSGASHASPLDLYFMGLIPADEVPPVKVFNPRANPPINLLNPYIPASEIIDEVTIDEIIAAHGARTPGPAESQKAFNIGFLAESHNRLLTPLEMTFYEILAAHYTKTIPDDQPAPSNDNGWVPISRFFGHGSSWSTLLPGKSEAVNNAPVATPSTFYVSETVPPYYVNGGGSIVGRVAASDPDGQSLTYGIRSGNEARDFIIDPVTGDIRVSRTLAHARQELYEFEIVVADSGVPSKAIVTPVTIHVTGPNRAPLIANQSFEIDENSVAGTVVGTVVASDPDTGQTLTYALVAGGSGRFNLNSATGALTVAVGAILDFETTPFYDLTIAVTDSGTPTLQAQATIRVNLRDVVELPTIRIDVVPGDATNTILLSDSAVKVAILSGNNFDALQAVDLATLRFGRTGTEATPVKNKKGVVVTQSVDVNGDGLLDLVVSFTTNNTGLTTLDTNAILKGALRDELAFSVSQSVVVKSGKPGRR